jgi:hypothetical protein
MCTAPQYCHKGLLDLKARTTFLVKEQIKFTYMGHTVLLQIKICFGDTCYLILHILKDPTDFTYKELAIKQKTNTHSYSWR